ncbi:hypothetical protein DKX38_000559 [Salix brachista]|uniref:DUF676 domain-containing protein n=1 Tax=Salix brachista TaxID=2182728 RepID=A0A5N5P137_9ROSI|nr:hypothetical protein DKX38_000559 [Salix brachista]
MENRVCSTESVTGSCDVWSCQKSASADHLVIMVHGILGSKADWKFGAEQFVRTLPDKVFVHCSEKNMFKLTLDGVDVMGERLAEEVLEVIQRKQNLRKISFVAHSVGGLVARYAIGRLYRPPKKENVEDFIDGTNEDDVKATIGGLEPMNFITVATPHLGSRGNKQVPFLFGVPAFEKAASLFIHWIFKRTGRHLFLTDDDENNNTPLLKRLIGDCDIVGWRTSSIRRNYELPKWEDYVNKEYPHIVYEEHCKACDAEQSELISTADDGLDKLEEELVIGLSRVSWEKVDVSFHASRQSVMFFGYMVKDELMHMEGIIQYTSGLRGARASSLTYRWDPPNGLTIWRSIDEYFKPEEVPACIVTCGGLCRGINTVILWRRLWGFLSEIYISVVAHGMMQVYHTGMPFLLFNLCFRYIFTRKLRNVGKVTDKSFGIDTAVKAAQRATNAAHVEIESEENGVGIVNLMGRYSGKLFEHSLIDGNLMTIG